MATKYQRKVPVYRGNKPDAEKGWSQVGTLIDNWILFERLQEHDQEWRSYKLIHDGESTKKSNYWCSYNGVTGSIGYGRDLMTLQKVNPPLYQQVMEIFQARAGQ